MKERRRKEKNMKIADGLLIRDDIGKEIGRLENLARDDSHGWMAKPAGEEYMPKFDLEENHQRVMKLQRLQRRLSRAITRANNDTDLVLDQEQYDIFM